MFAVAPVTTLTLVAVGFGLVGVAFVAIGVSVNRSTRRFLRRAVRARGRVVSLRLRVGSSSLSGPSVPTTGPPPIPGDGLQTRTFLPTVTFTTIEGDVITAESKVGSNPPPARRGQEVAVLYDPTNPSEFRIDSFLGRGGCTGPGLIAMGGVCVAIGALMALIIGSLS